MKIKLKLKKSNIKSMCVLISMEVSKREQQIKIWQDDAKMSNERKNKLIAEERNNIVYWESIWKQLDNSLR